MASASSLNALRIPGRLVAAPTDLAAPFPHGGTELGLTRTQRFSFDAQYRGVRAEEWGGAVVHRHYVRQEPRLLGFLRSWDADMITTLFADASVQASGAPLIHHNVEGAQRAGRSASNRAIPLLFAPRNVKHPGVLIYRAVPLLDETAELQLGAGPQNEVGLAFVFAAEPPSSGDVYEIGLLEDMRLSP